MTTVRTGSPAAPRPRATERASNAAPPPTPAEARALSNFILDSHRSGLWKELPKAPAGLKTAEMTLVDALVLRDAYVVAGKVYVHSKDSGKWHLAQPAPTPATSRWGEVRTPVTPEVKERALRSFVSDSRDYGLWKPLDKAPVGWRKAATSSSDVVQGWDAYALGGKVYVHARASGEWKLASAAPTRATIRWTEVAQVPTTP